MSEMGAGFPELPSTSISRHSCGAEKGFGSWRVTSLKSRRDKDGLHERKVVKQRLRLSDVYVGQRAIPNLTTVQMSSSSETVPSLSCFVGGDITQLPQCIDPLTFDPNTSIRTCLSIIINTNIFINSMHCHYLHQAEKEGGVAVI